MNDLVRAAEFYRLSAEQGYSSGQFKFGWCLENGSGVVKDLVRAAEFYRLSAEQGHSSGQFNLGRITAIWMPRMRTGGARLPGADSDPKAVSA
jgi:TPR repeat protein